MQRGDAPTHTKEHPPPQEPKEEHPPTEQMKKQARFDVDEDLGDDPTLPTDLTTFLVGALPKSGIMIQAPLIPCPWIPHSHLIVRDPMPSHPHGQACQRSLPNPPLLDPDPSHSSKGCQTQ